MTWADRLAQAEIRRLYRSAVLGIYDEEALQEVGSALFARRVDIATVADAFSRGSVPCPKCDGKVQRRIDPLYRLEGHGDQSSWFRCSGVTAGRPCVSIPDASLAGNPWPEGTFCAAVAEKNGQGTHITGP